MLTPASAESSWQCGRHYVHSLRDTWIDLRTGIIVYNRTAKNYERGNPKSDEMDFSRESKRDGTVFYRGKRCVKYTGGK
jgi:hypothetical protein